MHVFVPISTERLHTVCTLGKVHEVYIHFIEYKMEYKKERRKEVNLPQRKEKNYQNGGRKTTREFDNLINSYRLSVLSSPSFSVTSLKQDVNSVFMNTAPGALDLS